MLAPGVIIPYDGLAANIPAGFSRVTPLNGRFIKCWSDILAPSVNGGSDTHQHSSLAHNHPMNAHGHVVGINTATTGTWGGEDAGDGSGASNHNHGGSTTVNGLQGGILTDAITYQPASSLPPHFEVIWIQSNGWNAIPAGALIYSDQETLDGLTFCDGNNDTPDLRNRYLRGAAAEQNSGAFGGALNHEHVVTHIHSAVNHYHTGTTPGSGDQGAGVDGTIDQAAEDNHHHSITLPNTALTGDQYVGTAGLAEEVEPAYKKLNLFKNVSGDKVVPKPGVMAFWPYDPTDEENPLPIGWETVDEYKGQHIKASSEHAEVGDEGGANTHGHAASNSHSHGTVAHDHPVSNSGTSDNNNITGVGSKTAIRPHRHQITVNSANASWQSATISANESNNEPAYRTAVLIRLVTPIGAGGSVVPRFL